MVRLHILPKEIVELFIPSLNLQDFVSLRDSRLNLCHCLNDQHVSKRYFEVNHTHAFNDKKSAERY